MDGFFLEIITKGEVTKHLKECTVTCSFPTFSISPVRIHFWQVVTLVLGGISAPVKYGFSGAIPALISRRLLSPCGIREKLFITKMSFALDKVKEHLTKFVYSVFLHNLFLLIGGPVQQYPGIFL